MQCEGKEEKKMKEEDDDDLWRKLNNIQKKITQLNSFTTHIVSVLHGVHTSVSASNLDGTP